jgi:hypothetical protein
MPAGFQNLDNGVLTEICDGSTKNIPSGFVCPAPCTCGYKPVGELKCTDGEWDRASTFKCLEETCSAPVNGIGSGDLREVNGVVGPGCGYNTAPGTECGFNCALGFWADSEAKVKCSGISFTSVAGAKCRPISEDTFWGPPTVTGISANAGTGEVVLPLIMPANGGVLKSTIRKYEAKITPEDSLSCAALVYEMGDDVDSLKINCGGLDPMEMYNVEVSTTNAKGAGEARSYQFCTFVNPECVLKVTHDHGTGPASNVLEGIVLASAQDVLKATVSITGHYEPQDRLVRQPGLPFEGFVFTDMGSGVIEIASAGPATENAMNIALREVVFSSTKGTSGDLPAPLRLITIEIEYVDGTVLTNSAEVKIIIICLAGATVTIGRDDPSDPASPIYATIGFESGATLPADGQLHMTMPAWFDALNDESEIPYIIHGTMHGIDGEFHPLYVGGKLNAWDEPIDAYTTQDLVLNREGDGSSTPFGTSVAFQLTNIMVSLPEFVGGAYELGEFRFFSRTKQGEEICRSDRIRATEANGIDMLLETEMPTNAPTVAVGETLPPPPAPVTGYDPSKNSDNQLTCDDNFYGPVARRYGSEDLPKYFNWYGGSPTRLSWYMPYDGSWQAPGMKGSAPCYKGLWGYAEPWKNKNYLSYIGGKDNCAADANGAIFTDSYQQTYQKKDESSPMSITPNYPTCDYITRSYWHTTFTSGSRIMSNPTGGYDQSQMVWNGQWYSAHYTTQAHVICERDGVEGNERHGESYNGHFYWGVGRNSFESTSQQGTGDGWPNPFDWTKWKNPTLEEERCQGWYCYMKWGHAQEYCRERGGYLVEPTTAAENKWVREYAGRATARVNNWWYCPEWMGGRCYWWWRPNIHLGFTDVGAEDCWQVKTKFTHQLTEGGEDIDLNKKGSCQTTSCKSCPDLTKMGGTSADGICNSIATSMESIRKFKQQCGITCKLVEAEVKSTSGAETANAAQCYPEDGEYCAPEQVSTPDTLYYHGAGAVPVLEKIKMGKNDYQVINKTVISIIDNFDNDGQGGDVIQIGRFYPNSFAAPVFDVATASLTIDGDDTELRYAIAIKEVEFTNTKLLAVAGVRQCLVELYYKDGTIRNSTFEVTVRGGFTNVNVEIIQNQGPPTAKFQFTSTFPIPADGGISLKFPTRVENGPVFSDILELRPSMLLDSVEFGDTMLDGRFLEMQLDKTDSMVTGLYGRTEKAKDVELKFNRALNYVNSSEPSEGGLRRIGGWEEDWMTGGTESGYFRNFSFTLGTVMKATGLIDDALIKTVPITMYTYDGEGGIIDGPLVVHATVTKACDYAQCLMGTADGLSCIQSRFPGACGKYMADNQIQSSLGQDDDVVSEGPINYHHLSSNELEEMFCKGSPAPVVQFPAFYRGEGNQCPAVRGEPDGPAPNIADSAMCPNGWQTRTTTYGPWDNNNNYENWIPAASTMPFDYYTKSGDYYPGQVYDSKQVGDGPEYYLKYYAGGYGMCNGMFSDSDGDGSSADEPWGYDIAYMQGDGKWRPYVSGWIRSGSTTMCEIEPGGWDTCEDDFDHKPEAFGIKSYRGWWDRYRGQRSAQYNNKCYVTVNVPNWNWQWMTAREYCDKEWGGHLVTIESEEEQQFVFERMLDFYSYPLTYSWFPGILYLGFNDFWNEGCWNAFIPSHFDFWLDAQVDGTTASCKVTECVRCNKNQILSDGGTKCIDPEFLINMPDDVVYNVNYPPISLLGAGDDYKLNFNLFTFESKSGNELFERINVTITNRDVQDNEKGDFLTWTQGLCYSPEHDDLMPCQNTRRSQGVTVMPYNRTSGELILQGPATIDEFHTVLKTIEFYNNAQEPSRDARIVRVLADRLTPRAEQASGVVMVTINNAPEIRGYDVPINNEYLLAQHRRGMATRLWPDGVVFDPDHHDFNIESLTVCRLDQMAC